MSLRLRLRHRSRRLGTGTVAAFQRLKGNLRQWTTIGTVRMPTGRLKGTLGLVTGRVQMGVGRVRGGLGRLAGSMYAFPSSATVLIQEGFESGSLSGGWFDDTTVPITTDARPGSTGTSCLALAWTSGAVYATGVNACRRDFTPTETVYISYWVKHSSNWVGSGVGYHPHLFHTLTNNDDHWSGLVTTHLSAIDELHVTGGNIYGWMTMEDGLNINAAYLGVDLTGVTESRATCGWNGQPESGFVWEEYLDGGIPVNNKRLETASPVIAAADKTAWHHIEVYRAMNSISGGIGQPDGVMQMWVDGTLAMNRSDIYFRTGAQPTLKWNTFVLAPYIGDGSPATQSMWIDDLTVATSRSVTTPTVTATVTGTATTSTWYESVVVGGGATAILTLTNTSWVAAGTTFDAQRQNIIDGFVAATSPANGWNAVRSSIPVTACVRTSATVVTITLPALASYSVTANQSITVTIPATATLYGAAIVATPTLTIVEGAPGSAVNGNIFEWGFENSTYGPATNGSYTDGGLVGGDYASPGTRGWSIITGSAYRGTKHARWSSASSTGGSPFMCYPFIATNAANPQPNLRDIYLRIAFRPLSEPNDFHKMFLFRQQGFGTQLGTFDYDGTNYQWFWNNHGGTFSAIPGLPSGATMRSSGLWYCLEFRYQVPASGNATLTTWLNDTLLGTITSPSSASSPAIGIVEIGGTLNSGSASFEVDSVGISTARMYAPA